MPTQSYRDDPSREIPDFQEEEEEYSFLPAHEGEGGNGNGIPRSDGYIGAAGSHGRGGSSRNCCEDIELCRSGYSRLSIWTRSMVMLTVCGLLFYGAYEFGVDEGEREGISKLSGVGNLVRKWKVFGGTVDEESGNGGRYSNSKNANSNSVANSYGRSNDKGDANNAKVDESPIVYSGRMFTKEQLLSTRKSVQDLVDLLHDYYAGETTAKNMLMRSWQVEWKLNVEEYLEKDEEDNDETGNWDDDDNSTNDDDDDNVNEDNDNGAVDDGSNDDGSDDDSNTDDGSDDDNFKKKKRKQKNHKKNKKKHENNDDDDSNNNNYNRHLGKKKGVKRAKTIHNHPDNLTPEQIQQHKHYSKQRTTKLITTMAQALLNPLQDDFKIGTIGSSVAAGHDNCHYDSYESQLQRTLFSVFQSAGMNLIVQNAGEGGGCGDTHENQVFCITHNVSPDVDIIHYSWTYFEHGGAEKARESLIRWGQQMPKRPMVHHLVARGKANTCEGDSKENAMLDNTYAAYGYNAFCIQTGLYFGGHDYDKEQEEGINRFGWQQVGDGYHNTTRYGELEEDEERRNGLGTVYRNWHPGPLGFQIASDAFAYVYSMGVLMALELIEKDMDAGLDPRDRWFVKSTDDRGLLSTDGEYEETELTSSEGQSGLRHLSSKQRLLEPKLSLPPQTVKDMPEPLFCDPLYCSIPHPPSCINYEKPTYGVPGPTVQTQNEWKIWKQNNNWAYEVGKKDIALFKRWNDEEWYQKCTHLDACGGITASDSSKGELVFELPASKMTTGLIIVCGCCGKKVGEDMFLKNENLEIKLNGKVLNKSKMDIYPNRKCVRLVKAFKEFDEDSDISKEDEFLLSFNILDDNGQEVKISHLIAL